VNSASLPPGTRVGPWRVRSLRGCGSYGVVYNVLREGDETEGPMALKMALRPLDPRFEREGEMLSRLRHAHVPRLQDWGCWTSPGGASYPYLVMDWFEGTPLYEWAARDGVTSHQALVLLGQVASALAATHALGGVHRDVKGDNVLVLKGGDRAVLVDFGTANFIGARRLTWQPPPPGTPQYQSPECLRFQWEHPRQPSAHYEARPGDDVYALGVMAYRLVAGRYPPPAADIRESDQGPRLIHPPLVPPESLVRVSPELAALVRQLLSVEPSARGTAAEVARAFERAAKKVGRKARLPIKALDAPVHGLRERWPVLMHRARAVAPWMVAAAGVALVVGTWWSTYPPTVERLTRGEQEGRDGGTEEGSVGLGDAMPRSPMSLDPLESEPVGVCLEMPKQRLPGQRRPPCKKPEIEINGGCWARAGGLAPPCDDRSYEWENACYWPLLDLPRSPTSELP
jgi:hypothetical protein